MYFSSLPYYHFSDKLTPSARIHLEPDDPSNNFENVDKIVDDRVTDLSRDLLTEVAHQSLPPSGIPVPVPTLVHKRRNYWIDNGYEYRARSFHARLFKFINPL